MTTRAVITIGDARQRHINYILSVCARYFEGASARAVRGMYKGQREHAVELCIYHITTAVGERTTVDEFEALVYDLAATLRDDFKQECVLLTLDKVDATLV